MTQLGLADSFQRPRQRVVACTHTCISVKVNALVNIYYFVFFSLLSFLFPFFYYFFSAIDNLEQTWIHSM